MAVDGKDSAERDQTDEGLRKERRQTDRALAERQAAIEKDADIVVQHARETADAVLTAARDEADEQLDRTGPRSVSREAAKEVREREDEAVLAEREAADESLQRERDETARALRGLLPLERERTDRYLLTERMRSDEALSNRDDFLGIVSHDLRDLLGGIVMSASLLARAPDGDTKKQTLLQADRIQRYAARMNRLIGDLLDVASLDAGQLALTPACGDAAAVISEAVETFRAAASASSRDGDHRAADSLERRLGAHAAGLGQSHHQRNQVHAPRRCDTGSRRATGGRVASGRHRYRCGHTAPLAGEHLRAILASRCQR